MAPRRAEPHRFLTYLRPARFALSLLLATGLAVACSGGGRSGVAGVVVAEGFSIEEVVTGLDGPTQLTGFGNGALLLAELAGGESEGTGRVVAITVDGERELLFDGLLTPTGVAVLGDEIWVMEQRTLSKGPITGGTLTPVLGPLPYNGRSETTLTATPGGTLLYGTSGSLAADTPADASGTLWELERDGTSTPLSAGFKNPYAHVIDGDGGLWVTEISDGSFDGRGAPDELVAVTPGVDHGWPRCVGDRVAVEQYGGDTAGCEAGPPSHALFSPGATPTSVAVAPWDPDTLVVALWGEERVVTVPRTATATPHQPVDLLTGDLRPQHLLADGDRLLVVDFDGGRILSLSR